MLKPIDLYDLEPEDIFLEQDSYGNAVCIVIRIVNKPGYCNEVVESRNLITGELINYFYAKDYPAYAPDILLLGKK